MQMVRKPAVDGARYDRVWRDRVYALKDVYEMNP
jgi:acyl-CoA dehydrogenase